MPELMVAMTVLFIVSTFIMSMFVTGLRQTGQATQNQDLETFTKAKLSELAQMDYGMLDAEAAVDQPLPGHPGYRYTVAFSALETEALADARVVEVTVTHPEYGTRSGRTVRCNIIIDPGKAAWEKFGCAECHSLPGAGYIDPVPPASAYIPLGPIPVGTPGFDPGDRPIPPGPNGLETYIKDSINDPAGYKAYDPLVEGSMSNFYVEGVDPEFDPASTDDFIRGNSMSQAERDALATWIVTWQ